MWRRRRRGWVGDVHELVPTALIFVILEMLGQVLYALLMTQRGCSSVPRDVGDALLHPVVEQLSMSTAAI